ncbi:MAG: plasmid pRiA4b ORF-3 family protein, partial [Candidatus Dechloromonas phosphoritropha]
MIITPCRLRLKITLEGSEPAIWRRVEVNDALTFFQLHRVIQEAMGWEDDHLHEFVVARQRVGTAYDDGVMFMEQEETIPERRTRLSDLLKD